MTITLPSGEPRRARPQALAIAACMPLAPRLPTGVIQSLNASCIANSDTPLR
jgi:hypothetical protein